MVVAAVFSVSSGIVSVLAGEATLEESLVTAPIGEGHLGLLLAEESGGAGAELLALPAAIDLLDQAINSTLPRTIITGATTFLALLGLTFFGGEVLQSFTQAMLFGVVVGIYSTTFIASPILIYLGVRTQSAERGTSPSAGVPAKTQATTP